VSQQHNFEYWLRFTLPKNLKLSDSKKKAMETVFGHFADYASGVAAKAPEEVDFFFKNLQSKMSKVERWRPSKAELQ
jgi:hypothetical protein